MQFRKNMNLNSKHIFRFPLISLYLLMIVLVMIFFNNCNPNPASEKEKEKAGQMGLDSTNIEIFPLNTSIRAIFPISDDSVWFGGSGGQFGYTEDAGKTWYVDSISHPDHANLEFRSISVVNNSVFLLSVASPALLFKSTDKGKNWNIVYRENDSLSFYDAMAFWDEKEGIAMGDPTERCLSIIKTIDGGDSWVKLDCSFLPETIEGEAAFAASNSNISLYNNHVWIVTGGKKARVFHSPDRGEKWEVFETPIVQGGQMTGIFSCDFYNENTGIVFGGDWNEKGKNTGNKAITHDGGKTWSLIADGIYPGYQSCVQFINENSPMEVLTVGIPGIAYSSDGGISWIRVSDQSFYTFRKADRIIWLAGKNKIARWKIVN